MSQELAEILHQVPDGCTCYIDVYHALFGWKARMMVLSYDEDFDDHFWEPENTTYFQHPSPEPAVDEGRRWAAAEEVPFVYEKELI
jgi:hypothetical protein